MQFCDDPVKPNVLFTENETRPKSGGNGFYKDAFHKYIINGKLVVVDFLNMFFSIIIDITIIDVSEYF